MEPRLELQARNEALFREVNERIGELARSATESWARVDERFEFACECGRNGGCAGIVSMTLTEYDHVRQQDDRFAVTPGHQTDELERVVERSDHYLIVDKVPEAEPFVSDDPRGAPSR